jgi:hypothetical protein
MDQSRPARFRRGAADHDYACCGAAQRTRRSHESERIQRVFRASNPAKGFTGRFPLPHRPNHGLENFSVFFGAVMARCAVPCCDKKDCILVNPTVNETP